VKLQLFGENGGQGAPSDDCAAILDGELEVLQDLIEHSIAGDGPEGLASSSHARQDQEVVDQRLHAFAAIHGVVDKLARGVVEFIVVPLGEELREAGDGTQGFL
jgi:hypothetical protein